MADGGRVRMMEDIGRIGSSPRQRSAACADALPSAAARIAGDEFASTDSCGGAPNCGDAQAFGALRTRAQQSPCSLVLVVSRPYWDPETEEAAKVIELAVPLLEEAAGARVEAVVGDTDPFVAVHTALERSQFDEAIISTLPQRVSHWLGLDLPTRVERLGVPVAVVTAAQSERAWEP